MKRIFAMLLTIVFCMSMINSALAANVCSSVSGSLSQTITFEARTGNKIFSSDKIVLTQTEGVMNTYVYYKGRSTAVRYGHFEISVYDNTGRSYVYRNAKWNNRTFTISGGKLKKNRIYTITVKGITKEFVADGYSTIRYSYEGWNSYPMWRATKTGGNITYCQ